MGIIFDAFIKWLIGAGSGVFDILFKYAFSVLGANLSIFEAVVPGVKILNAGIFGIAISLAFVILLYKLFHTMTPTSDESVVILVWNFIFSVILIGIYRPLFDIVLGFVNNTSTAFDNVAKGLKIIKSKNQALPNNLISSIYTSLNKGMSGDKLTLPKALMSIVGADIPQKIVAFILSMYIASKLYRLAKIAIQNYVDIGIMTYLAPLPIAFHVSKSTDIYFKNFLQMYMEKAVIVILNGWFIRVILAGFNMIKISSFAKNKDLIASFRSSTANSFIPLGTETIAVMILWIFIIAAVIEFAIELNSYIAKLGIGGGATLDKAATKRGIAGQIMQTAERMAVATGVRAVAGKVGSAIQGRKNSGNSKNGADSRRSNDSGRNGSENSSESNPRNNEKPNNGKNNTNGKETRRNNPYNPLDEIKSSAAMDNLLGSKMSGRQAKNQLATALGNTDALMKGKDAKKYLDNKKREATDKADKKKLDNALVFNTKSGGKQILSGISSDGKGNIKASLGNESVELKSSDAMKSKYFPEGKSKDGTSVSKEPEKTITETASIDIGGQKMYYDPVKSPGFHKMMGNVNFDVNNNKKPKDRK